MKDKLKDKKVKCRICNGEHFTARCPFKDTMAPVGEEGAPEAALGTADMPEGPGGLGSGKSSYVPPHLRNGGGAASAGDRMGGGKYERDDLATLRVTNVSRNKHHLPLHILTVFRSQKWLKNKSFATCSSGSEGLQECSWRRTERLD
jgi:Eukaryotic translation initiation factor 3 subunit G